MLFKCDSPSELSIQDLDTLCQYYLTILYQDVQRKISSLKNVCESYGEILYPSIDKLMSVLDLSERDVFIDYGSGLGKVVIQIFLKSRVKEAYGIEILPELHFSALNVSQRLQHELPAFFKGKRKLTFLLGSFLETPLSQATVALVNSTCFTVQLLSDLGKIIEQTPTIHTVLSLRPIPTLQRLVFKKSIRIECSWDSALCYIYKAQT